MTLQECWQLGRRILAEEGFEAWRLETDLMLCRVLGVTRARLYSLSPQDELPAAAVEKIELLLSRRQKGTPLAYLLGEKEFYGFSFAVGPGVLIPRPETELLVGRIVAHLQQNKPAAPRLLDLCCGSGAIGISVARYYPVAELVLSDRCPEALAYARINGEALLSSSCLHYIEGDLLAPFAEEKEYFQVIACNPPYIPSGELAGLMRDVRDYEPHLALDGGADGLSFYRRLLQEAPGHLHQGGLLAVEIGWNQGKAVRDFFVEAGLQKVEVLLDFAGKDRVVTGIFTGTEPVATGR